MGTAKLLTIAKLDFRGRRHETLQLVVCLRK
jgi:hypothetical protein